MRVKKYPTKVQEIQDKILPSRFKEGNLMKISKIAEFCKIFILYFIFYILYYDTQHIKQKSFEDMSLGITDYTLINIKVAQVSHHQGDLRYCASRDTQCSCMLQEFMIENCPINVELMENKTGEITARAYLLSIAEIVNSAR